MSRKVICYGPFCYPKRIKHLKSSMIERSRKHYCKKCWKYLKDQRIHRSALYHYIEDKAMIAFPTGRMLMDIKRLVKQRNYTYHGIKIALMYADKFSLKFKFRNSPLFLHYVPYVYDRAQRWNYNRERRDFMHVHDHVNNQVTSVKVDPKVFQHSKKMPYYDLNKF